MIRSIRFNFASNLQIYSNLWSIFVLKSRQICYLFHINLYLIVLSLCLKSVSTLSLFVQGCLTFYLSFSSSLIIVHPSFVFLPLVLPCTISPSFILSFCSSVFNFQTLPILTVWHFFPIFYCCQLLMNTIFSLNFFSFSRRISKKSFVRWVDLIDRFSQYPGLHVNADKTRIIRLLTPRPQNIRHLKKRTFGWS